MINKMNLTGPSKLLKLEVKELVNEHKILPDINFPFPNLFEDEYSNLSSDRKLPYLINFLDNQKKSLKTYKKTTENLIRNEKKKEDYDIKRNMVYN